MTHLFTIAIAGLNLFGLVWLLYLRRHLLESPRTHTHRSLSQVVRTILALTFVCGLALLPARAYACSGILDCAFGWTERTEVRAARDIEQERIQAQAAAEQARIEGEAAAAVRMADAEVERVKQAQFQNEAQRDIAIAQANAAADQYKAMIAGLTNEKLAGIEANAATQIQALQAQAEIATAGILETGKTERYRIVGGWASVIVALVLAALVGLYWMKRNVGGVMVLPQHHAALGERKQLPWYSDDVQIVEVKHNASITRKQ